MILLTFFPPAGSREWPSEDDLFDEQSEDRSLGSIHSADRSVENIIQRKSRVSSQENGRYRTSVIMYTELGHFIIQDTYVETHKLGHFIIQDTYVETRKLGHFTIQDTLTVFIMIRRMSELGHFFIQDTLNVSIIMFKHIS